MKEDRDEEQLLRDTTLQSARSIFLTRQRAEEELVRAKDALWEQSEWLRVTLASIGDAVVTTDREGRVLSLNAVAETLTGWTQQEARGRPLAEVFRIVNEETRQPVENPAERVLREGRIVGLANHTILIARDGSQTPIDDSAAPIRDDQGRVHGVVLIFRSIAERKQADEALARLAAIVESSQDAIISKTLEGRIVSWNTGAEQIFGYRAEEAVGQLITLIIPPERHDEELMILERLRRGERIEHYETVRVTKDGRRIHVSLTISPVRDSEGRIIGASKISRDITARKQAEQRLAAQNGVTRALAESGSLEEAAPKILRAICERLGWRVGGLWRVDENEKALRCVEVYHPPDIKVARFEAASRGRVFERGVGLPGRVWASGEPVWIGDIGEDNNFPRAAVAVAEGLHSAFGFPIKLNEEVLGVMEFFSQEIRQPEPELLEMMTAIGSQIGQFIERKRAEEALRESENRLLLAQGIANIGTFDWNIKSGVNVWTPELEAMHGLPPGGFAGAQSEWKRLVHTDDREQAQRLIERAFETGKPTEGEWRVVWPDGSVHWLAARWQVFKDNSDAPVRMTGVNIDITARKQAEQALQESEQQLRLALEAGRMGTWEWDVATNKVTWSAGLEAIHGLAPGAFEGTFDAFQKDMHPEDRERVLQSLVQTLEQDADHNVEYRIVLPEGGIRWVEARGKLFRDKYGLPARMLGVCSDITERKQAEQTTHFLADASSALAELTDYESTLQKVAALAVPHFADWCAVDVQEADGAVRRLAVTHGDPAKVQLVHELDRKFPSRASETRGVRQVIRTGKPEWAASIPDEMLVELTQGEEHLRIIRELGMKSYISVPLKSRNQVLGALTFVTAESGRVYDAENVRAAEDLAHRAVIAIENANLLAELKESARRKDEFLAILAHELRNPLAPIRNAVEILRVKGQPEPELQWACDVIGRQVDQMTRLVDDLLDVSRITRGKIELRKERIELRAVVNDAVEASRPLIEQSGHTLSVELPPEPVFLEADPTRLAQVLLNLLNNAAKYTELGGRIWLTAGREGKQVVIRVKDTGVGIPPDMLPHIFEMFAQVDRSIERAQGGLGIGLTLAQRLAAMHGGRVEARSEGPGKGSEFIVRLPAAEGLDRAAPKGLDRDRPAPASTPLRILVVDDNLDSADSLAIFLSMMGHEVRTAHDGLTAVEEAANFQPSVILMDIGLPKLNGYEAARRIREQGGDRVVLIALTGWGQEEDRRRSREAGFDHHLTKPVNFKNLNKLIAEHAPPISNANGGKQVAG